MRHPNDNIKLLEKEECFEIPITIRRRTYERLMMLKKAHFYRNIDDVIWNLIFCGKAPKDEK